MHDMEWEIRWIRDRIFRHLWVTLPTFHTCSHLFHTLHPAQRLHSLVKTPLTIPSCHIVIPAACPLPHQCPHLTGSRDWETSLRTDTCVNKVWMWKLSRNEGKREDLEGEVLCISS